MAWCGPQGGGTHLSCTISHDAGFYGCGDPAANVFCNHRGFARALHYEKRELIMLVCGKRVLWFGLYSSACTHTPYTHTRRRGPHHGALHVHRPEPAQPQPHPRRVCVHHLRELIVCVCGRLQANESTRPLFYFVEISERDKKICLHVCSQKGLNGIVVQWQW